MLSTDRFNQKPNYALSINDIKVIDKIGSHSLFANVFVVKSKLNNQCYALRISKSNERIERELDIIKQGEDLLLKKISPSFPILYNHFPYKEKEYAMICHLANTDLEQFIREPKCTLLHLLPIYFQIFQTLYCLKKYMNNSNHGDLKTANILIYEYPDINGYIKYIFKDENNDTYYIPFYQKLAVLWDFEFSKENKSCKGDISKCFYDSGFYLTYPLYTKGGIRGPSVRKKSLIGMWYKLVGDDIIKNYNQNFYCNIKKLFMHYQISPEFNHKIIDTFIC